MFDLDYFGIKKEDINRDLTRYIEFLNSFGIRKKKNILKEYVSIEDYIEILYYFRFVKKLDYEKIGEILLPNIKKHNRIYIRYSQLGWCYSLNFDEVEDNMQSEIKDFNNIYEDSKSLNINAFDNEDDFVSIYNNCEARLNKSTYLHGYGSWKQYVNAMYYFVKKKNLSTAQIGKILKMSTESVYYHLAYLNLNYNVQEAQKNATRNYKHILTEGRKTLNQSMYKSGTFGSNIENNIRTSLAIKLMEYINNNKYEIIVGINNKSIIPPKEVDIPIIIVNRENESIFKFAIEINGEYYHQDLLEDKNKINELSKSNWMMLTIWQMHTSTTSDSIEQQIDNICQKISIGIEKN